MSGAKRAPSSSVKKATAIGWTVATPCCSRVSITSSPASTPRLPSNRPPVATVSMCDPVITGAAVGSVPRRVATTLPMASMATSSPRSRIQPTTRSRPARSSSVRARRAQPSSPSGPLIAPTSPSSTSRAHSRSPSTRSSSARRAHPAGARRRRSRRARRRTLRRRRRTAPRRARPWPAAGRRSRRRRRSRPTATRTTRARRSARSGWRPGARVRQRVAAAMSTSSGARWSMSDVSSVPAWTPMPSSAAGDAPPWSGGTPGWARNVSRPWCNRSSRLATLTRALLPP